MAKKTETKTAAPAKKAPAKAAPKAPKAPKAPAAPQKARHPKGRITERHGSKADLAKSIAGLVARDGEDHGELATRLGRASNQQLLRLQKATETLKSKWGSREKLIAAIGAAKQKSKDKDYLAKLAKFSLPQLISIAPRA